MVAVARAPGALITQLAVAGVEAEIRVLEARLSGTGQAHVINGADVKATNTFDAPDGVTTREDAVTAQGSSATYTFEPHSVTALVLGLE